MLSIEQTLLQECLQSSITVEDDTIHAVFSFPSDFPAFAGHFPGQPVLPAVVQLAAVRFLAAGHLGWDPIPKEVLRAKFKAMITPDMRVRVQVRPQRTNSGVRLAFTISTDKETAATGEITCSAPHDTCERNQ